MATPFKQRSTSLKVPFHGASLYHEKIAIDHNGSVVNSTGNAAASEKQMQLHETQMQAFWYTVAILVFYALLILYFMLKQICRQEKEYRERLHMNVGYFRAVHERQVRATMKKQLCVHLIKMGQLTQSFITTTNRGSQYKFVNGGVCTKDQATETDETPLSGIDIVY